MKVRDLIEALEKLDPEFHVWVGDDTPSPISQVTVVNEDDEGMPPELQKTAGSWPRVMII